jgi:signal transduction histidine kinase
MLGRDRAEMQGRRCRSLTCAPAEGGGLAAGKAALADGTEELTLRGKNGETPVLKSSVPVDLKGRTHLLESYLDMTAVKRAHSEHAAREALQAAIETAGAACHELNQPIQGIMNLSEAAREEAPPGSQLSRDLEGIMHSARQLAEITKRLSNITSYRTTPYSEGADILDLAGSSEQAG